MRWLLLALLLVPLVSLAFWLSLPSAQPLARAFPKSTALMDTRDSQAHGKAHKRWTPVPLARISPWLQKAVVNSEDARFYEHKGVDTKETEAAIEKAMERGHLGRGASTLTQQLAKNLWLGEERSLLRKLRELVLAHELESLGKERILELYLNVVEWGQGAWGAEAASQQWFGVDASQLSPAQAAILTAMLPAPRRRDPRHPSPRLVQRALEVLDLYGMYHQLSNVELTRERAQLLELLGVTRQPPPPPEPSPAPSDAPDDIDESEP
ncbi:MAG: monofunctional biosynthetic peptidoglycan transglycosylase [Deltaproteobacteria bacterium]|nr:monofunctional biosynthetic peptidoglycan transglycosylase [Deltaproteobacteria bacterium]